MVRRDRNNFKSSIKRQFFFEVPVNYVGRSYNEGKKIGEKILLPEFKRLNTNYTEEQLTYEKNRFLRADKIISVIKIIAPRT